MNVTILLVFAGGLLFTAVLLTGYALLVRRPNIDERVTGIAPEKWRFDFMSYIRRSEKVLKPLGQMLPRSPEEMSRQERRLAQAGIRRKDGPALLYGVKIVLAVILL